MRGTSLFDKLWNQHVVVEETAENPAVLYIDLHLIHEVTSPQAFTVLREKDLTVRCPERTLATMDHSIPTLPAGANGLRPYVTKAAQDQVSQLEKNCADFGITLHGWDSPSRGIVHVIGPELGATQPGKTIVCGDSHTSTHGAFGALAFGIGTTEVGHVLATQCLLQRKPKSMAINVTGKRQKGVSAKDIVLAIIEKIGVNGGTGHVIEYRGEAIEALTMEERMTVCNMSIEAGARAGMIAPDQTTFDWLEGKDMTPKGSDWEAAVETWKQLKSDPDAKFDTVVDIDISALSPMVTYGTHPGMAMQIDSAVPDSNGDTSHQKALDYMQLTSGTPITGTKVGTVFVGSCTNSRLSDLQDAAAILRGHKVHPDVRMLVVPGSAQIKKQAEALGLDKVFMEAGAQWRDTGCSMCIAMNGDQLKPGELGVSTSNRNFEGRQGKGGRTVLASPMTAAACAIAGEICDPRDFLKEESYAA